MTGAGRRPVILVNCAVSVDGRLAYAKGRRAWLSGPEDLDRVQRLRASVGAIVVGVGTVLADDPSLKVHWERLHQPPGPSPLRVVLDSVGRTPPTSKVLDGSAPTLLATTDRCRARFPAGIDVVALGHAEVDLEALWSHLGARGIGRVLVEGGGAVLASVFREGRFDEATVFVAPVVIGGHDAPSLALGSECPDASSAVPLEQTGSQRLGEGTLLTYRPRGRSPR